MSHDAMARALIPLMEAMGAEEKLGRPPADADYDQRPARDVNEADSVPEIAFDQTQGG